MTALRTLRYWAGPAVTLAATAGWLAWLTAHGWLPETLETVANLGLAVAWWKARPGRRRLILHTTKGTINHA